MELTKEEIPVKEHEEKIKNLLNNYLKKFYELEKENFQEDPFYDWRPNIKGIPTINKIDYEFCDIATIMINFPGDPYEDSIIFFQEDFLNWLDEQEDSSILTQFDFWFEDYPGIWIEPKYE